MIDTHCRPYTYEEECKVIKMKDEGHLIYEIAEEIGRTKASVRKKLNVLRRNGWKPRAKP